MYRFYLIFGLINLSVIFKLCSAIESTTTKRVQKCQEYSASVYGDSEPTCEKLTVNDYKTIPIKEFPHIAVFGFCDEEFGGYSWKCHGTLVSSRYILTVAQCVTRFAPEKVRLGTMAIDYSGESKPSDYDVENVILHPLYKLNTYYNDIGLVKISQKVEFSENIRPICLPSSDFNSTILYQTNYETTENINIDHRPLTKYQYKAVKNEECNEIYKPFHSRKLSKGIADELLCSLRPPTSSVDYVCRGEAGAPLYVNHLESACSHIQLGISSFAIPCSSHVRAPGVYTKVFSFSDWIENIIWADDEDF